MLCHRKGAMSTITICIRNFLFLFHWNITEWSQNKLGIKWDIWPHFSHINTSKKYLLKLRLLNFSHEFWRMQYIIKSSKLTKIPQCNIMLSVVKLNLFILWSNHARTPLFYIKHLYASLFVHFLFMVCQHLSVMVCKSHYTKI